MLGRENRSERGRVGSIGLRYGWSVPLNRNEFIKLVDSTYPIVTQERYSKLDLVKLADEYKEEVPLLGAQE